jgi:hypothetical protein
MIPLTATPDPGHRFCGWNISSGILAEGTSADPVITIRMDQPATLTAVFLPLTPRDAYNDWATAMSLSESPGHTPFGDGTPNLLKYAFNLNPAGPDSHPLTPLTGTSGLPCLSIDRSGPSPVLRLEYIRRRDSGLGYTAMESDSIATDSWTPMTGTETSADIDTTWQRVTVERTLAPQETNRFFKVEVTIPDTPL